MIIRQMFSSWLYGVYSDNSYLVVEWQTGKIVKITEKTNNKTARFLSKWFKTTCTQAVSEEKDKEILQKPTKHSKKTNKILKHLFCSYSFPSDNLET